MAERAPEKREVTGSTPVPTTLVRAQGFAALATIEKLEGPQKRAFAQTAEVVWGDDIKVSRAGLLLSKSR